MGSTAQHITATRDPQIFERLVASAEMQGVPGAEGWVRANIGTLVSVDVDPGEDLSTVASILNYKNVNYVRQLLPGEDPSAVTDSHLDEAVRQTLAKTNSPAQQE